jgi:hypothetical protein
MHTIESKPSSLLGPIAVSALVAALVVTAAERIRRRNERITQALAGLAEPPTQPCKRMERMAPSTQSDPAASEAATGLVETTTDLRAAAPTGVTLTSPRAVVES